MSIRMTRRRLAGALAVVVLVGGLAGTVALRAAKRASDAAAAAADNAPPVALEFAAFDLTQVTDVKIARWLPVSGTLEPVRQAIVKAKVAGDVVDLKLREGDPVRAGQRLARIESADLASRLSDRMGALESARAQLALADKTRTMNLASAARPVHLAKRFRQRRIELRRRARQRQVRRSPGPAR